MKMRTTLITSILLACLAGLSLSQSAIFNYLNKSSLAASPSSGAQLCGSVSAYSPATATASGLITIGGLSHVIAPGVALKGVAAGKQLCFSFCFDADGKIVSQSANPTDGPNFPQVCGIVTSFNAPLGGTKGSINIGGARINFSPGIYLSGQEQVFPGTNTCLIPVEFAGLAGPGSFFVANTLNGQVRIPAIVHGRTFGPNSQEDTFALPEPMVMTLDSNLGTVFSVNQQSFGKLLSNQAPKIQGFSLSTPNSSVQASSCTDSLWDAEFEIASNGLTDGDMVTFNLLNADRSVAQQIAMFTIENGGAALKQLHSDVRLTYNGMSTRGVGHFSPFMLNAGSSGLRTLTLALVFSPNSQVLNGCFQLAVGIKRSNGIGTTSVALNTVVLKRMERPSDRDVSISIGQDTNLLGWYPTGRPCEVVCSPCGFTPPPNPPPQPGVGWITGFVYCDDNDNGVFDNGEKGIANVVIKIFKLVNGQYVEFSMPPAKTDKDGYYQFDVPPGTYKLTEIQPDGIADGKERAGNCGEVISDNMFSNIIVNDNFHCKSYDFGERCNPPSKCDTICWRSTQFFITNIRYLPGGAILIPGVNANNPVGIQQNISTIRTALQGGSNPAQKLSKEFVTAQLSLAYSGGTGSPVVFNTFWSPLVCSGVSFQPVTLSNGVSLVPNSLLDTLVTQTTLAIKQNRSEDMEALAGIWFLFNGKCGQ